MAKPDSAEGVLMDEPVYAKGVLMAILASAEQALMTEPLCIDRLIHQVNSLKQLSAGSPMTGTSPEVKQNVFSLHFAYYYFIVSATNIFMLLKQLGLLVLMKSAKTSCSKIQC